MVRTGLLLAVSLVTLLTLGPAHADGFGVGAVPPDVDIRALEPPIDVTESQLRAQQYPPVAPVAPVAEPVPVPHRSKHRARHQ